MNRNIEHGFFNLLQSDVILSIAGKQYKSGKFLNFKIKEFYIELDLVINNKYKKVNIPIPFKVIYTDDVLIFSYKLEDIGSYGKDIIRMIQNSIGGGKSKLYNKELRIERVDNDD